MPSRLQTWPLKLSLAFVTYSHGRKQRLWAAREEVEEEGELVESKKREMKKKTKRKRRKAPRAGKAGNSNNKELH